MIERVVIVHGHSSSPARYWFESLRKYLISLGCAEVLIPQMPHPQLPDIKSWKRALSMIIQEDFENTALIGHSFGGISAFRFAEILSEGRKLGAIIAISSPVRKVWHPLFPARILFREPDWGKVVANTKTISLVYSTNDWISPFNNALYLQKKLDCQLFSLEGYNHICCSHLPRKAKTFIAQTLAL